MKPVEHCAPKGNPESLQAVVPIRTHEEIQRVARDKGMDPAEVVRDALVCFLEAASTGAPPMASPTRWRQSNTRS